MRTAPFLHRFVDRIESEEWLDATARPLDVVSGRIGPTPTGALLRGDWLGHALHPLLTDLSLGCWLSAGLLDLAGGRRSRPAATRLVGLGLTAVPLVAAAGVAEYGTMNQQRQRRSGVAHAMGNAAVAALYLASWRSRRRGRHLQGVAFGMAGGGLAWVTGYLGGHLSFGRGVGVGARGDLDTSITPSRSTAQQVRSGVADLADRTDRSPDRAHIDTVGIEEAAAMLQTQPAQVRVMIEQGLLTPVDGASVPVLDRAEVLAVRNLGG